MFLMLLLFKDIRSLCVLMMHVVRPLTFVGWKHVSPKVLYCVSDLLLAKCLLPSHLQSIICYWSSLFVESHERQSKIELWQSVIRLQESIFSCKMGMYNVLEGVSHIFCFCSWKVSRSAFACWAVDSFCVSWFLHSVIRLRLEETTYPSITTVEVVVSLWDKEYLWFNKIEADVSRVESVER